MKRVFMRNINNVRDCSACSALEGEVAEGGERAVLLFLLFYLSLKGNKAEQLKKCLSRNGSSVFGFIAASNTKPNKPNITNAPSGPR
jgi:hypothetical protein